MNHNAQIETREIADDALDAVAGGAAALALHGDTSGLHGFGGVELAGHGVTAEGAASLQNGTVNLSVATF
ncbi:hypothetical protein QIS99_03320 [Streptomyces sp. B-S-A8]|uniref:Type A2 lantipeptide n=1 Tax=Streptomyces solicavernae TaxID=3043614 RepID=A0ABT6RLE1_9ACTN|nr:hypothetical protein [Streptomyces sp. B-S-A8]MDI3385250.1 hypothetical protein [Streptomyces sp. B-S-A8]